jgi:ASC-1-like (ASCH) protein
MKEHIMHLSEEPFNWMKEGRKIVEVRLYDEKRKGIEIGDVIVFKKLNGNEEIKVKVKGLLRFERFEDLFLFIPKKYLAHESLSLSEHIERIRKYYSEEKERKYGVLAIWFEVIK